MKTPRLLTTLSTRPLALPLEPAPYLGTNVGNLLVQEVDVLSWPNITSVLVSAVMEVESLVTDRQMGGESTGTVTQSSGYHHRPKA
jgi:hypothetical protein